MIDASIIAAPRQRSTDAEKADLKAGRIPESWTANPAKLRQKDRDGRWTLKRGRRKPKPDGTPMMEIATPVYGYKSLVGVDRRHRFIRTWSVTDAARYDGRELPGLLDRSNTGSSVWADTAYRSAKNEKRIAKAGLVSKVHFRKPPGKPMPEPRHRANAPARGSGPASSMSSRTRSTAWACSSARSASPERQNRPRQHRLQHAPASVLGDGGRDSISERVQPEISGRQTRWHDRPAQPPAADDPFRRTSNAGKQKSPVGWRVSPDILDPLVDR